MASLDLDPAGKDCLDVGASTGGFTDCLLQRGAAKIWAIDVGHGQIDWKLRSDARVVIREGVNARYLAAADFAEKFDLIVCDTSFISLTLLIPALPPLLAAHGRMVLLVKPQFEVERGQVGKGGIVREPALHEDAWPFVAALVDAFTLDHCLWASDWPYLRAPARVDYGVLLHLVRTLFPGASDRRKLLWDTPRELFGFSS